jgi:hypothetical protein
MKITPRLHSFLSVLLLASAVLHPRPGSANEPGSVGELFNPPQSIPPGSVVPPLPPLPPPLTRPEAAAPLVPPRPPEPGAIEEALPILAGLRPGDTERRKLKGLSAGEWGFVKSEFVWRTPEAGYDAPFERGEWSTEDLLAIPLTGPFYVFGEAALGGEYSADQEMKVTGKTGVLWKMPLGEKALELRGGPTLTYNDALRGLQRGRDQGTMAWEVKGKLPLLGPLGLEYIGSALPALTPDTHSQLKQDLALAIPVTGGGKVKFGAKQTWIDTQREARTAPPQRELYLGIEIGREINH